MTAKRIVLAGLAAAALAIASYRTLSSARYPRVEFDDRSYVHVELSTVNEVANHLYTPEGVEIGQADRFIQISRYDSPDLSPEHVRVVQAQIIRSFALRPIEGHDDRFFGMFRGRTPVYGYMGADAFALHVGPEVRNPDPGALGARTKGVTDELLEALAAEAEPG